jgi:hypothetical protein
VSGPRPGTFSFPDTRIAGLNFIETLERMANLATRAAFGFKSRQWDDVDRRKFNRRWPMKKGGQLTLHSSAKGCESNAW